MEGAADPGGPIRQRRRRRQLGACIGLVVVCAAAAAVAVWAGVRPGRSTSSHGSAGVDSSGPSYVVPQKITAVDSGIKNMGPLSPSSTSPLSLPSSPTSSSSSSSKGTAGATAPAPGSSIGTFSGTPLLTNKVINDNSNALASLLGAASSTASTTTSTSTSTTVPAEQPPANAPAFQSLQGRISSGVLGLRTCYPKTGAEVVTMSSGSNPCTVLILTKSSQDSYVIRQTMNITSPKIFIGNPIDPPILNTTKIERLFDVRDGGFLDIRAVQLYKGIGRRFDDGSLVVISGCTIRVWPGGYFRGTEVFFREIRQTLQAARNDINTPNLRRRIFGGHVLVMGGNFRCIGCMTFRFVPFGVLTANQIQIGRDILVIAGLATYVGGYAGNAPLFMSTINVGNNFCVFGGAAIWIGGGGLAASAAIGQFGAFQNLASLGGILLMVGYQDTSVFLAVNRAGFGQYGVGGGVYIMVGELENRVWGVGSVFNAGQAYSCGGGIMQMIGGDSWNAQISTIQAIAGGSMFLGSGDMLVVGFPFGRFAVTQAQYGCGMVWFNGAGTATYVYTPGFTISVVRAQILRGIEMCMGYGMNTNILNTRRAFQVVNALIGGNEFFIGGGAAVFIRVRSIIRRKINYRTSRTAFYVAGTEVIGAYSTQNIFVNKDGIYLLPHQHNNTKARGLPALTSGGAGAGAGGRGDDRNRSSLVLTQTELDTVSGVSLDAGVFKAKLQELLLRKNEAGGQRRLSTIGPLGGVSIVELAKVWRAAFDASDPRTSTSSVRTTARQRKQEIESVYVGGKDNQCFLCGVSPLPSAMHLPPPTENVAECTASDACVADNVPRTAAAAIATAEAAAPEPLLLPPHVKYSLPLMHRKLLTAGTAAAAAAANEDEDEDGPYPDLPTVNLLAYDLVIYCAPPQVPPQQQEQQEGSAGDAAEAGCGLAEAQVKKALKALARRAVEDGELDVPFQLTAASTTVDLPVLRPALEEEMAEALAAVPDVGVDGCSTRGSKFAVYMTTAESEGFDALHDLFESWRQGQQAPELFAALAEASGLPQETFCSLRLRKKATLRLPPINTSAGASYYQTFYTAGAQQLLGLKFTNAIFADDDGPDDTGSRDTRGSPAGRDRGRRNLLLADVLGPFPNVPSFPSLLLLEEGRVTPVDRVVAGRAYTVSLSHFNPDIAGVEVKLYEGVPPTTREEATLLIPKGTTTTTDDGALTVRFVAPEPSVGAGARGSRAYLRASYVGLPMPFADSLAFDLVGSSSTDREEE